MNDTAKGDGGLDIDALATKVVDQLAGRLAGGKAVIVNQPPAIDMPSLQEEHKKNLARDALAAARSFGSDAIRFAFIINGGALTAILAYLGTGNAPGTTIIWALVAFAAGAVSALGAAICAYAAQSGLADKYKVWDGKGPYPTSIWRHGALILLGACAFSAAVGSIMSFEEMQHADKDPRTTLELKISRH